MAGRKQGGRHKTETLSPMTLAFSPRFDRTYRKAPAAVRRAFDSLSPRSLPKMLPGVEMRPCSQPPACVLRVVAGSRLHAAPVVRVRFEVARWSAQPRQAPIAAPRNA